jgi:hypothetical protein
LPSLSQLLGVRDSARGEANRVISQVRKRLDRPEDFKGMVKSYSPLDEEGEQLPGQSKKVLTQSNELLGALEDALTRQIDVESTVTNTNSHAKADLVVGTLTLLENVPGVTLIFLEKQLEMVLSLLDEFPVQDPERDWTYDASRDQHVSEVVRTTRSVKTPRPFVLAAATQYHPAQVQVLTEDVIRGYWATTDFSAAFPAQTKKEIRDRVIRLREAVGSARERANMTTVSPVEYGEAVFDFILRG